jgi:hypothetical protein
MIQASHLHLHVGAVRRVHIFYFLHRVNEVGSHPWNSGQQYRDRKDLCHWNRSSINIANLNTSEIRNPKRHVAKYMAAANPIWEWYGEYGMMNKMITEWYGWHTKMVEGRWMKGELQSPICIPPCQYMELPWQSNKSCQDWTEMK